MLTIRFDLLAQLAGLLESLPPEQFKFNVWATSLNLNVHECGTTGCALGWATTMPECGIELRRMGSASYDSVTVCSSDTPAGAKINTWDSPRKASEKAFGLSRAEHEWLFVPSDEAVAEYDDDGYRVRKEQWGEDNKPNPWASAKTVAEHIRNFIAAEGIPS